MKDCEGRGVKTTDWFFYFASAPGPFSEEYGVLCVDVISVLLTVERTNGVSPYLEIGRLALRWCHFCESSAGLCGCDKESGKIWRERSEKSGLMTLRP